MSDKAEVPVLAVIEHPERWIVRKRHLVRAVDDWDPARINDPAERLQWVEVVPLTTHQGAVEGVREALEDALTVLQGDVLDSIEIARIEVDVRAALYRLGGQ